MSPDQLIDKNTLKFRKYIDSVNDNTHRLIISLLYETGCTLSELVNIKLKHLNLSEKRLTIPKENAKNKTERKLPISSSLNKMLSEFSNNRNKSEYLFHSRQGNQISPRRIEQILVKYSELSQVKITQQGLRKVYMQKAIAACRNTKKLRRATGLKNIIKPFFSELSHEKIEFENLRDQLIFSLILETGCKTGELCNLKIRDIKNNKIMFIQKHSEKNRTVLVSDKLMKGLSGYTADRKRDQYVFPGRDGQNISKRRIQQIFLHYSNKADKKITPNRLRRISANSQYSSGKPVREIRKMLGISQLNVFTYGFVEI